jgi:hypothetical protein
VNSGEDSRFDSWPWDNEGCLSPFVKMDEDSSKEVFNFFGVLDVASAVEVEANEGPRIGPRYT